ncbi:PREDICTED: uncharacterized protein LOC109210380 [Nicotiana attenuata]|uniref:uncharacterized protein LOC109210380 n=1 Tax=Nicotiana attenuata TaxID=49451 RepID=UPI000904FD2A|nr:PREDICTED: uncharacterized protein LOC109210380 [Nicotiana attenuata]
MVKAPMLGLPNFSKPFTVEVDASGVGVAAVLTQNGRHLAYLSQALSPKNLGLSTYEKELVALLIGKDTILVVVDKYTKYAHFITLSHPYNAIQVAQLFLDNVFKLHGAPCSVVSDRDPIFVSNFWKELLKGLQVQQKLSTAYHPQMDGQSKRLNRCLETQLVSKILQDNLHKAKNRMKQFADKKRSDRVFEVGDFVFLKLQPYRQISVMVRKNLKLAVKYYGQYKVISRIGAVAYELELPVGSKIHPVFHVSQLKKKVGSGVFPSQDPPYCNDEGQILTEPIAILERRLVKKGNKAVVEVLLQWADLSKYEATWEDFSFLKSQFPNFAVKD